MPPLLPGEAFLSNEEAIFDPIASPSRTGKAEAQNPSNEKMTSCQSLPSGLPGRYQTNRRDRAIHAGCRLEPFFFPSPYGVLSMRVAVLAFACLMASTAAFAQTEEAPRQPNTSEQTQAEDEPAEKAERKICRRLEGVTGSRLSGRERVCLTAEQWRAYDR
jgi:hypothetical protein